MIHNMTAPIKTYLTIAPAEKKNYFFFLEKHCLSKEKPVFLGRQCMPLSMAFLRSKALQKLILCFFSLLATTNMTSEPTRAYLQHSLTKVCHCLSHACLLNCTTLSGASNFEVKADCCISKEQHSLQSCPA